jgi:putative SOS response-associated peptidase YedK
MRLNQDGLEGEMMTWAWLQGKRPVFNFVSEGRDFSETDRRPILAPSFYEYTAPQERKPTITLQDQHQFTLKGDEWFWIAGIVKQDCFTMLTAEPGPDIAPFHDRQIVILRSNRGMGWLNLSRPHSELLRALSGRRLIIRPCARMASRCNSRPFRGSIPIAAPEAF